jgi:hypothetical protein
MVGTESVSYASKESGESIVSPNAESFKRMISELTQTRYTVVEALPEFPPPSDQSTWYLLSLGEIPETAHAHKVWIDGQGRIRIESMYLGNTSEWIEYEYGEEEADAVELDYPDLQSTRKILEKRFPLADKYLGAYQSILDEVSAKYGISLEMRCQGGKMVATFFMDATIDVKNIDEKQKAERIKLNLDGLKEAWDRISKYEAERERRQG